MSAFDDIYSDPLPAGFVAKKPGKPRLYQGFEPGAPVQSVGWGDEGDGTDAPDPNVPQWGPMSPGASAAAPLTMAQTGWPTSGMQMPPPPSWMQPQAPQQMPWDRFRDWATAGGQQAQRAVQGAPSAVWSAFNDPLAAGVQGVNAVQHMAGSTQPPAPTPEQAVQQGTITPGQGTTAAVMGGLAAGGPEGLAAPVAGGVDLARAGAKAAGAAIANPRSVPGMVVRGPLAFAMGAAGGGARGVGGAGKVAATANEWSKAFPFGISKDLAQMWKGKGMTDEQIAAKASEVLSKAPAGTAPAVASVAPAAAAATDPEAARVAFNANRTSRARNPGPSGQPFRTVAQRVARAQEQAANPEAVAAAPKPRTKAAVLPAERIQQVLQKTNGNPSTLVEHFATAMQDMTPEQVQAQLAEINKTDPELFDKAGVPGLVTQSAASLKAMPPVSRDLEQAAAGLLSKATPRYGYGSKQFGTSFESDVDRLIYTVTKSDGRGGTIIAKDNKTHAKGIQMLRDAGLTDQQIIDRGQAIRDGLKAQAKNGKTGATLKVARAAGDQVQAKQSIAKAAQQVAAKRVAQKKLAEEVGHGGWDPEKMAALEASLREPEGTPEVVADATGGGAEPPKMPDVDTSNPFDDEEKAVVENLPGLPVDIQDAAVSSMARKWTRNAQIGAHAIGGTAGFLGGYNQDQNDDQKTRILYGLLYGGAGLTAAHVVSGGKLSGIPNRAMEMYRRQLLSPSTVIVPKGGQDTASLVVAPIVRGLSATIERGPVAGVEEAIANTAGYWPGARMFPHIMAKALDMRTPLSSTYGEAKTASELASPGEGLGTIWARLISGLTDGVKAMHESGTAWANARPLARKEAELWKTTTAEKSVAWLKDEMQKDPSLGQAIAADHPSVSDKIESGLWSDPEVADFAQQAHVQQQVNDYGNTLPKPKEVAKDWTLTGDIGRGIKAGSKGQGGFVARLGNEAVSLIQDTPFLNPTIRGMQIPIGKMIAPFKTVVANAADQFINFIPLLGEINQRAYPEIRASTRIAKQIVGGLTTASLLSIVGDGATDNGPQDANARKKWIGAGNIANAWRGPDGRWYPIHVLPPPLQVLMRTAGALNGYQRDKMYNKAIGDQAKFALREFGGAISDASVFSSLVDLAKLVGGVAAGDTATATREAGFMLGGLAGSNLAVPATAERPNAADTSGSLTANLLSRLPGIEKGVPDRPNSTGTKPVPNPDQGWRSLLGSSAGREPLTDATAEVFYHPDYGPGLNINRKAFGSGANALPLPPDLQRDAFKYAGSLLQAWTPFEMKSTAFTLADKANKQKFLANLQNTAVKQAFWHSVDAMGKDNYLNSLPEAQKPIFRAEDLEHTRQMAIAAQPYQTASGQPVKVAGMTAKQGLDLQNKYKGMTAAQIKTAPPGDVAKLKELATAASYAKANSIAQLTKSPAYADWVQHQRLRLDPATWQHIASGQEALIGKPGQYDLNTQLAMYGKMLHYTALPAGPQKAALKPSIEAMQKQSNLKLLQQAESAQSQTTQTEAQSAEQTTAMDEVQPAP